MGALSIVLLILAALVVALYVAFRLLARGQLDYLRYIVVDGVAVYMTVWLGSKLPKLLRAAATTVPPAICFRGYLASLPNIRVRVKGGFLAAISLKLAAHEAGHFVRYVRAGWFVYWYEVWRDILLHPLNHDARKSEQQADRDGALILAGTMPGVEASAYLGTFR